MNPPAGQAIVELSVVLMIFSTILVALLVTGVVGELTIKASHGARFAAFDCEVRPDYCRQSVQQSESKLRSTLVVSDQREVFPNDNLTPREWATLAQNRHVLKDSRDVRLDVDLPRVDGADRNLLEKLAGTFRSFTLKAGPAIFDLANPDHLSRSTVHISLWSSQTKTASQAFVPEIRVSSRLALISDAWAAVDATDLSRRTRLGETPSSLVDDGLRALYFPTKDLLMPLFDLVGLESNTRSFRDQFHVVDHDMPYANSRVTGVSR